MILVNKNLYLDIHAVQTVPPSCINRDDTGSPKAAVYGGVPRARVSSQAWKRAIRMEFASLLDKDMIGVRTKHIVGLVSERIADVAPDLDSEKKAIEALENAGIKVKSAEKGIDALFFMSGKQAEALATLIASEEADKQKYKDALKSNPSVDMALFGRMVASDPSLNYDAAAQVAHAISTHTVRTEFDYFTAVDDCSPEDNAGAGHLGTVEFNSSTLYRYATVNVAELAEHLGEDDAKKAIQAFVRAFVIAMPTGKQNTFANRTLPSLVYVTLREDQPVNLVGAFECPIQPHSDGFVERSIQSLCEYAKDVYSMFSCTPAHEYVVSNSADCWDCDDKLSFSDMLQKVNADIGNILCQ